MSLTFPNESSEYRAARSELLRKEIGLRRELEAVAEARRALPPGGELPEDYIFDGYLDDGTVGKVRLSELFRDGNDTLVIYQMMFPRHSEDDREVAQDGEIAKLDRADQPCPSCTALLDQVDAAIRHFEGGGGAFAVVAKTPLENLTAHGRDRGWRYLRLLSAAEGSFKRDYNSEDENGEQLPLMTVFRRDPDGKIRHFWSSEMDRAESDPGQDPRALGTLDIFWNLFDLTPHGRPTGFREQLQYRRSKRLLPAKVSDAV